MGLECVQPWVTTLATPPDLEESTKEDSTPQVPVPALHLQVPHQEVSGDELANLRCGSNAMMPQLVAPKPLPGSCPGCDGIPSRGFCSGKGQCPPHQQGDPPY